MNVVGLLHPANISFGEFLLSLLIIFFMVIFFIMLFQILFDLFRSKDLSGWAKAGWALFIIVLPFLGLLIYVIVRGQGMADRQLAAAQDNQEAFDQYVRETAGSGGPTAEIAKAKELLDSGAISQEEFDAIKRKQLS
ncbi:MAG: SHOCT domain-containing protein [Miltoncostaeaceae bacterium]